MSTREYTVTWSINIDADTPVNAAREALAIQRDPYSTAVVFRVERPDGSFDYGMIDLEKYGTDQED